jgi:hypothetical protein
MTKSKERGENEISREAKQEAARTNRHVCDVLAAMLAVAKQAGDVTRQRKIIQAQKFLRCRNVRRRRRS